MSNDIMGYDTNTREAIYENEFADRYEDLLNEVYPDLVIGYSTFTPGEVMREMAPLDFRMGMLDYWNDLTEDGEVVDDEDDLPILCTDCLHGREDDAEA